MCEPTDLHMRKATTLASGFSKTSRTDRTSDSAGRKSFPYAYETTLDLTPHRVRRLSCDNLHTL